MAGGGQRWGGASDVVAALDVVASAPPGSQPMPAAAAALPTRSFLPRGVAEEFPSRFFDPTGRPRFLGGCASRPAAPPRTCVLPLSGEGSSPSDSSAEKPAKTIFESSCKSPSMASLIVSVSFTGQAAPSAAADGVGTWSSPMVLPRAAAGPTGAPPSPESAVRPSSHPPGEIFCCSPYPSPPPLEGELLWFWLYSSVRSIRPSSPTAAKSCESWKNSSCVIAATEGFGGAAAAGLSLTSCAAALNVTFCAGS